MPLFCTSKLYLYDFTFIPLIICFCRLMKCGRPSKKAQSKRKCTSSTPPVLVSPKKRLKWTEESMLARLKLSKTVAVLIGLLSIMAFPE